MKKQAKKRFSPDAAGFVLTGLLALAAALFCFRIGELDLHCLYSFTGDHPLGASLIKSIDESGLKGLYFCARLGAPGISEFIDTPFFDLNLTAQIWLLSRFTHSYALIYYLVFFFTFPTSACAMYLLSGKFTKRIPLRSVTGLIYALAPYHFYRGMAHITLSNYFVVPMGIWLALLIAEEPFRGLAPERFRSSKLKIALMYAAAFLLGISNIYYAFFSLFCMILALVFRWIGTGKFKSVPQTALLPAGLLAGVLVSLLPKMIYSARHGANLTAGIRQGFESEIYALKIIQLLLPPSFTRSLFLSTFYDRYVLDAQNLNENRFASLGAAAAAGFLFLAFRAVFKLASDGRSRNAVTAKRLDFFSLTVVALLLYCMAGGFGTIVSYFVTPEIRCLNRASIVISCICLCAFVIAADRLLSIRKELPDLKKAGVWLAAAGIPLFSLYADTYREPAGTYTKPQEADAVYTAFFAQLEAKMDAGDMIYEMPYMPFPESGSLNRLEPYQLCVPYLYTETLRWSHAAMQGRAEPLKDLTDLPAGDALVQQLRERGFAGVYIDTGGYRSVFPLDDTDASQIDEVVYFRDTLGIEPLISEDGTLYFFDLRSVSV